VALTTASRIAAVLAILAGLQVGALTPIAAQPGPEDPAAKAPPSGPGPAHAGLIEEQTFLAVKAPSGAYRLEAFIVRPARAQGRLPIALITHHSPAGADRRQDIARQQACRDSGRAADPFRACH
jgi:hypothetical protein